MKKAAIILMGICLCLSIPVAAEAAQTSTSSVTQQSKHHQHDSTGYPHGHDTIRTCTGELSA